ncbi:hypothetical protein HBB16_09125 [Pseudonocardia sp. MCCB 268]|nr:hypothetical protein [Pseudonocardia cytotoxica]
MLERGPDRGGRYTARRVNALQLVEEHWLRSSPSDAHARVQRLDLCRSWWPARRRPGSVAQCLRRRAHLYQAPNGRLRLPRPSGVRAACSLEPGRGRSSSTPPQGQGGVA